ncbi:sulfurtransferase-like selenium metabolism protein YedF [Corynebacterium lizhenjunii]|uniref:sulfurtransferase-like selenium metabolism protein YedF n=1 Tax=Corynebacterium lizhenjunii TaxID=2709394 RepID=UPI0013EE38F2|nr:sulfurtransferase-like selenium metabolism protein YedF [Corynebacterium lizhenjunii]
MTTRPDFTLDLCGESCPYPVIHTLEALEGLEPGQTLEVTTDCPQAFRNVPDDATAAGHELVGTPSRVGARMTFVFRRGEEAITPTKKSKTSWWRRN